MNERPFARTNRVGALIHEGLSLLLQKSINDPRLESATITGVKMSTDLKLAKIYFVISDRIATREEAFAGFEKAKGFIKYSLAQTLKLRYMPELHFYYDNSIDYGFHMDSVLKKINDEHTTDNQPAEKE
ncbi:MAG: ribosome-binding factor A [Desulfobacterales bacterium CG23_combo_of_CG06-09_8_20_14_all_51_8]|nr:MAG: ribosome-binding factor A [Desulfobacterales bacterium CG23_combo_of_CG06-09_8_20_14_all_51_8]